MQYNILFLRTKSPENCFLKLSLRLENLSSIFFGKENYSTYLRSLIPLKNECITIELDEGYSDLITLKSCIVKKIHNLKINTEDIKQVFYFDMLYFPFEGNKTSLIYSKMVSCGYPSYIVDNKTKNNLAIVAFSSSFQFIENETINNNQKDNSTSIKFDDDLWLKLDDPIDVIKLFINGGQLRHFNTLVVKGKFFVKKSKDIEKMNKEYCFFKNAPSGMKPFHPQIGAFIDGTDSSGYEIEQLPMIDVGKLFINNILGFSDFKKILDNIDMYFSMVPKESSQNKDFQNIMTTCFIDKVEDRFKKIQNIACIDVLERLCELSGFISIEEFKNSLLGDVTKEISNMKSENLYWIHGDLFFSNILYDINSNRIKVIDPKGTISLKPEYPLYYDLAKLSHSFCGLYDLLAYNQFKIEINKSSLKPELIFPLDTKFIKSLQDLFRDYIEGKGVSFRFIRLLEATLFLSMIPLHKEDEHRMCGQLVQAISIYNSINN